MKRTNPCFKQRKKALTFQEQYSLYFKDEMWAVWIMTLILSSSGPSTTLPSRATPISISTEVKKKTELEACFFSNSVLFKTEQGS